MLVAMRIAVAALLVLGACAPEVVEDCGYGEGRVDGVCAPVSTLFVDVDERVDGSCRDGADGPVCTSRRGIGVNVCPVEAATALPDEAIGECAVFSYPGESPDRTFRSDAGLVVVGLAGGSVGMAPAPDADCYGTDLVPGRDDLFTAGEAFSVSGFGGDDVPAFELELVGPEPLAVDRVAEVVRGEALTLAWVPAAADRVVVVVTTYDEAADRGARITCVGEDDGEVVMDPAFTAQLLDTDDTAQIFVLRQNAAHLEPKDAAMVVEGSATVSDALEVPLR